MPIYEYRHAAGLGAACEECFEALQPLSDEPLAACPACGLPVRRVPTAASVRRNVLSSSNVRDKGFTKLVRKDKGVYREE